MNNPLSTSSEVWPHVADLKTEISALEATVAQLQGELTAATARAELADEIVKEVGYFSHKPKMEVIEEQIKLLRLIIDYNALTPTATGGQAG